MCSFFIQNDMSRGVIHKLKNFQKHSKRQMRKAFYGVIHCFYIVIHLKWWITQDRESMNADCIKIHF